MQTQEEFLQENSPNLPDGTKKSDAINISGTPETIDDYLTRTKADPKRKTWAGTSKPGNAGRGRVETVTELEKSVRIELSDMNRKERRAWLKKQSMAAGQVRAQVLTLKKNA